MAAADRKTKSGEASQLDRTAWLKAAANAVADEGINGTRILPLSKRLGVTRGSFYWHYADHADFVRAFIVYWRDQQLRAIDNFRSPSPDPIKSYAHLLEVALNDSVPELRRLKVEFALRGYARRDAFAAKAVSEVDRARTDLLLPLVRAIANSDEDARSLSQLLLIQISGAQHAIAGPKYDAKVLAGLKRAMLRSLKALYAVNASKEKSK
jgi:AcrR family transcriptional regulator